MVELDVKTWLRVADLDKEDTQLIFLDEGRIIPAEETGFGKEAFEILVGLPNKEQRLWTMNSTSQRAVIQSYTKDTKKWVSKPITVFWRQQKVGAKDVEVIYARIPVVKQ